MPLPEDTPGQLKIHSYFKHVIVDLTDPSGEPKVYEAGHVQSPPDSQGRPASQDIHVKLKRPDRNGKGTRKKGKTPNVEDSLIDDEHHEKQRFEVSERHFAQLSVSR